MKTDYFFVYGTLKKNGLYAKYFDDYRISSEKATVNNMDLYKIGWFPGVVPGTGTVVGELHEYKEPDTVTKLMNRIEGCTGTKQELFRREHRIITTISGKKIKANIYIFNQGIKKAKLIKDGIWINKIHKEGIYKNSLIAIRNLIKNIIWHKGDNYAD